MSQENIAKLMELVRTDAQTQTRVQALRATGSDPAEALASLSAEHRIPFTAEEFRAFVASQSSEELSEKQLDSVAGGASLPISWEGIFTHNPNFPSVPYERPAKETPISGW